MRPDLDSFDISYVNQLLDAGKKPEEIAPMLAQRQYLEAVQQITRQRSIQASNQQAARDSQRYTYLIPTDPNPDGRKQYFRLPIKPKDLPDTARYTAYQRIR
jgi:hypothetical protein